MKNANENKTSLTEQLKTVSVAVSLFLTIGGVAVSLINYFFLNQLAPLATRVSAVEAAQDRVATKEQVDSLQRMVDGRLKSIEGKVEYIYEIHMK